MDNNTFSWIDIYQELANKILTFKNNRSELIRLVEDSYKEAGLEYKFKYNDGRHFKQIDPFTLFGSFNKGLRESNRIALLSAYKTHFSLESSVPSSFAGIPILNNMRAWFMDDAEGDEMETLWELFETALKYADGNLDLESQFVSLYDKASSYPGIKWNLSMALYWVRPFDYVNLDTNNRNTLKEKGLFDGSLPSGRVYIDLCKHLKTLFGSEELPFTSFPDFSHDNWMKSKEDNSFPVDEDVETTRYWLYSPSDIERWDDLYSEGIADIGFDLIKNLTEYDSKEDIRQAMKAVYNVDQNYKNESLAAWQFVHVMKPGDIIFVKQGRKKIIGYGIVASDYECRDKDNRFSHVRYIDWKQKGEWETPVQIQLNSKILKDITSYTESIRDLMNIFEIEKIEDTLEKDYPEYTEKQFLEQVYMNQESYETLVGLIREKKNVILQGPPGVGKTYAAKRLAYSMMGYKNQERVMLVQFHQSYSYEDFIEGFRPSKTGMSFDIKKGAFLEFCDKARDDSENEYFFIIDEINRGNLSKIFGELFMLIENDKRGNELQLLYSGDKFSVPSNVYIIGMMNTADRSLALLDYALRRRFAFYEMKPGFDTEGFNNYKESLNDQRFNKLIRKVEELNEEIQEDDSLGEGFCIGHSYFCNKNDLDEKTISNIVEYELIPLLKEYWFDEKDKVLNWSKELRRTIQ